MLLAAPPWPASSCLVDGSELLGSSAIMVGLSDAAGRRGDPLRPACVLNPVASVVPDGSPEALFPCSAGRAVRPPAAVCAAQQPVASTAFSQDNISGVFLPGIPSYDLGVA